MPRQRAEKIDDKLEYFMEQIQRIHDNLDMHEWIQDLQAWEEKDKYYLRCVCGQYRRAKNKAEFNAAEPVYNGY